MPRKIPYTEHLAGYFQEKRPVFTKSQRKSCVQPQPIPACQPPATSPAADMPVSAKIEPRAPPAPQAECEQPTQAGVQPQQQPMLQTGVQMAMPPQQAMAQITVPAGAVPGQQIQVNVNGAGMILTVPPGAVAATARARLSRHWLTAVRCCLCLRGS